MRTRTVTHDQETHPPCFHSIYNRPAPAEWISFLIGGIFSAIGFVYWVIRVLRLKKVVGDAYTANTRTRAWISAFVDNDEAPYTICKMYAQSFLFLEACNTIMNWHSRWCWAFSPSNRLWIRCESCWPFIRPRLCRMSCSPLALLRLPCETPKKRSMHQEMVQLKPRNVYEDLSRDKLIVVMIFITQAILIAFVVRTFWFG